jgi:hypothetical protein
MRQPRLSVLTRRAIGAVATVSVLLGVENLQTKPIAGAPAVPAQLATGTAQSRPATPAPGGPPAGGVKVPYPNSLNPAEVLTNIKAAVQQTHLSVGMKMPELAMRKDELQVRHILPVRSAVIRPGWLVVELQDRGGNDVAT